MSLGFWSEQGSGIGTRVPLGKNFHLNIPLHARQFASGISWVAEAIAKQDEVQARCQETNVS